MLRFRTDKLELGRVPRSFSGKEPEASFAMTAVATTGAALSPSMGRMTMPALRPIFATLNIRLGRWLPNPLSNRVRREVAARVAPSCAEGRIDQLQDSTSWYRGPARPERFETPSACT